MLSLSRIGAEVERRSGVALERDLLVGVRNDGRAVRGRLISELSASTLLRRALLVGDTGLRKSAVSPSRMM